MAVMLAENNEIFQVLEKSALDTNKYFNMLKKEQTALEWVCCSLIV